VAKKYTGGKKKTALVFLHDLITVDGEKITLDEFYGEFDDPSLEELKNRDYALAEFGDELELQLNYSADKQSDYDRYIRQAAPKEKAFVALQRMISLDINKKNWAGAIAKVNEYKPFFGEKNKKIDDLISILTSKWDPTIKIQAFGPEINLSTVSSGREQKEHFGTLLSFVDMAYLLFHLGGLISTFTINLQAPLLMGEVCELKCCQ
jgi:hypothetical protein